ncbi:DNA polymerase III subunit gamma/tau [Candidatus Saccharibacteria bacterium]|nr:DNA polymerase III subunit gamma/tau [Candidatus Saccharibacteria bacterium]
MAKALYRKYRPKSLSEVVGQEQVTRVLENSLKQGKISHAYLFIGPRGTGKTSVARIFAHEVNGFKYELEDDYVDIIEIDGASNRGIDNIRELREKVAIAPTSGKYKIYIIDEVHMLTKEAFNALLKTLEEPPKHVIFIMATTDAYKVPVTITSRAQTYTFYLADEKTMFDYLKSVCEKEKIKIDDGALKIVVKRGGGSFRDSLSLLDQISTLSDDKITKELVISAMGLPEDEKIKELLDSYASGNLEQITSVLKAALSSGVKPETLASEMISLIIDAPKPELLPLLAKLPEIKAPFAEAKLLVAMTQTLATTVTASRTTVSSVQSVKVEKKPEPEKPAVVTKTVEKTIEKTSVEESVLVSTNTDFDWGKFVETVTRLNDGVSKQLKDADYDVAGGVLNIYPKNKMEVRLLARDNNRQVLAQACNMKVVIHEIGDNPHKSQDLLLSKMSAIMGGEVKNDGGGNPF